MLQSGQRCDIYGCDIFSKVHSIHFTLAKDLHEYQHPQVAFRSFFIAVLSCCILFPTIKCTMICYSKQFWCVFSYRIRVYSSSLIASRILPHVSTPVNMNLSSFQLVRGARKDDSASLMSHASPAWSFAGVAETHWTFALMNVLCWLSLSRLTAKAIPAKAAGMFGRARISILVQWLLYDIFRTTNRFQSNWWKALWVWRTAPADACELLSRRKWCDKDAFWMVYKCLCAESMNSIVASVRFWAAFKRRCAFGYARAELCLFWYCFLHIGYHHRQRTSKVATLAWEVAGLGSHPQCILWVGEYFLLSQFTIYALSSGLRMFLGWGCNWGLKCLFQVWMKTGKWFCMMQALHDFG